MHGERTWTKGSRVETSKNDWLNDTGREKVLWKVEGNASWWSGAVVVWFFCPAAGLQILLPKLITNYRWQRYVRQVDCLTCLLIRVHTNLVVISVTVQFFNIPTPLYLLALLNEVSLPDLSHTYHKWCWNLCTDWFWDMVK